MIVAQITDKPPARVLVHQRPAVAHVRRFWMGRKKIVERAAAQDSGKLIATSGQPLGIALSTRTVESRPTIEETRVVVVHESRTVSDHKAGAHPKIPELISLGKGATLSAAPRVVIVDNLLYARTVYNGAVVDIIFCCHAVMQSLQRESGSSHKYAFMPVPNRAPSPARVVPEIKVPNLARIRREDEWSEPSVSPCSAVPSC